MATETDVEKGMITQSLGEGHTGKLPLCFINSFSGMSFASHS